MFSLTIVSPTYQTIDSDAHQDRRDVRRQEARVDVARATAGIALARAIDSDVRAVGRIVVCVEAAAEVSTAMISSLSSGEPSTSLPSTLKTSSELSMSVLGAVVGLRGDGDDHVDRRAG